jgi:hypothetical protein
LINNFHQHPTISRTVFFLLFGFLLLKFIFLNVFVWGWGLPFCSSEFRQFVRSRRLRLFHVQRNGRWIHELRQGESFLHIYHQNCHLILDSKYIKSDGLFENRSRLQIGSRRTTQIPLSMDVAMWFVNCLCMWIISFHQLWKMMVEWQRYSTNVGPIEHRPTSWYKFCAYLLIDLLLGFEHDQNFKTLCLLFKTTFY